MHLFHALVTCHLMALSGVTQWCSIKQPDRVRLGSLTGSTVPAHRQPGQRVCAMFSTSVCGWALGNHRLMGQSMLRALGRIAVRFTLCMQMPCNITM